LRSAGLTAGAPIAVGGTYGNRAPTGAANTWLGIRP